jgi:hypothetical protein
MNTLKEERNRGYVVAGIGGVAAFIAFFLPYITATDVTTGNSISWNGPTVGGGLYFELLAALLVMAVVLVLIYSKNVFGLTNMPPDKQIRAGVFTLIGAGIVGTLCELILALNHNTINGYDLTITTSAVGLNIGWWLYLLSAIAIVVGGVMALRNPQALAARTWQYPTAQYPYNQPYPPQSAQYPPYPATGQSEYPPYPPQYPADPELYQATELGQQYAPTERRSTPQTGPQQYPDTGPRAQPYPPSEPPPPPPPPYSSQQLPPM